MTTSRDIFEAAIQHQPYVRSTYRDRDRYARTTSGVNRTESGTPANADMSTSTDLYLTVRVLCTYWTAELLKLGCVVCVSQCRDCRARPGRAFQRVEGSQTGSDSAAGQLEVGGRDKIR